MPFGSVGAGEFGTYFIGYAATPDVTEQMLRNMFIGNPPGNYDRILDFSTAVTGTLFFVPLVGLPRRPPAAHRRTHPELPTRVHRRRRMRTGHSESVLSEGVQRCEQSLS